jgi:hypothetical protein
MENKTYIDGLEVDHHTTDGTLVLSLDRKALDNPAAGGCPPSWAAFPARWAL